MKTRFILLVMMLVSLSPAATFSLQFGPRSPDMFSNTAPGTRVIGANNWPAWIAGAKQAVRITLPQWVAHAALDGVIVNGNIATGGRLVGPPLMPSMYSEAKNAGIPDHIAIGLLGPVIDAWNTWSANVSVPGLPWYPGFEAFPGPQAPPTPSPPYPFPALRQSIAVFQPATLARVIQSNLRSDATTPASQAAITDFCNWFFFGFNIWYQSATISEVIGSGPVPVFITSPNYYSSGVKNGSAHGGKISPLPKWQ